MGRGCVEEGSAWRRVSRTRSRARVRRKLGDDTRVPPVGETGEAAVLLGCVVRARQLESGLGPLATAREREEKKGEIGGLGGLAGFCFPLFFVPKTFSFLVLLRLLKIQNQNSFK